jgi:hypothetical protein
MRAALCRVDGTDQPSGDLATVAERDQIDILAQPRMHQVGTAQQAGTSVIFGRAQCCTTVTAQRIPGALARRASAVISAQFSSSASTT